jgi:hypothetical protein
MSKKKIPRISLYAKVMTVASLPHDIWCAELGDCCCKSHAFQEIHRNRKGEIGRRVNSKKYPKTITFLAGRKTLIEQTALRCPDIAGAIRRGDLRKVP